VKGRIALCALAAAMFLQASSPSLWELSTFNDFVKGKFDGVSLGRDGRLAAAPKLDTLFNSEQPVVWALAPAPGNAFYAATGHRGRIFRVDATGAARLIWVADRPEVFALAVDSKGVLYAASSPDGKIYRIENGNATEYFDPHARYIWALALASDGTLYAGTGDEGKVFRITGPGKGEVWYATGQGNVTGLLLDAQGRLLAGTEPNGILYRITGKDKAFGLYDSSLPEVRAIGLEPDGSVLAAGLGGAMTRKEQNGQQSPAADTGDAGTVTTSITVTADSNPELKVPEPAKPQPTGGATPAATATTTTTAAATADLTGVEKSAIYRIHPDNTVETLWTSKEENVFDVMPSAAGEVYFTTDSSGRIYRVGADHKLTLEAQTNEAEATRLMRWQGSVLAATANMGRVYKLGAAGTQGSYESPVFDAGGVAKWGKLRWQGEGNIRVTTRSGNSLKPDAAWSEWSAPLTASAGAQIESPNARFLQFRAEFTAGGSMESVSAAYLPQNNPPVVRSITVLTQPTAAAASGKTPANSTSTSSAANAPYTITVTDTGDAGPTASTGTPTQTLSRAGAQQLLISWQADDQDGDRLVYDLQFRGEGERDWKPLRANLHENTYTIDGDALADGRYFFRVTASDRESNPGGDSREADLVSSPVLIDNTPPTVTVQAPVRSGNAIDVAFEARDAASLLRRAEYSIDAGPWNAVAPVDGILDSQTEQFRLHITAPPGEHVLVIRVADSGNNTGLAKVVLH
jgi:hypothetical protein